MNFTKNANMCIKQKEYVLIEKARIQKFLWGTCGTLLKTTFINIFRKEIIQFILSCRTWYHQLIYPDFQGIRAWKIQRWEGRNESFIDDYYRNLDQSIVKSH